MSNTFPIDVVVPWVFERPQDIDDQRIKAALNTHVVYSEAHFRDYGLFELWVNLIKKNMPWVRKIFVLIDNKIPDGYELDERVIFVKHSEYIFHKFLPTYNSNVIEMNIDLLDDLSEHFVLFNDDIFVLKKMRYTDFFTKDGLPKDVGAMICRASENEFEKSVISNMLILNWNFEKKSVKKNFAKYVSLKYGLRTVIKSILSMPWTGFTGWEDTHLAIPYKKEEFINFHSQFPDIKENIGKHKYRHSDDVSHWLIRYIRLARGEFSPSSIKKMGKLVFLSEIGTIKNEISQLTIVCVNDDINSGETERFNEICRELKELICSFIET